MHNEYLRSLSPATALEITQAAIDREAAHYRRHPLPGIADPIELRDPPSEEEVRLNTLASNLNVEQMSELTALVWLGRKSSGEELKEWDLLVRKARAQQNTSGNDKSYLCEKLPLGKYLMDGLEEIGVRQD